MQIVDSRALLFNTRKANQITAIIPKSKVVASNGDVDQVLVNWGFDEVQLLRNMGIKDVPSPIGGRYKWPGMFTPFNHQRTTAEFLTLNHRCFVFNEAGTGKTSAAAWAADYLMTQGKVKRVLIVCPVSIMETAWRSDLFKTVMHRTVAIAQGSRTQRQAVIAKNYEFVIINFDGVKVVTPGLWLAGLTL
jgi:superfamily II DNA or RNA helicase